MNEKTNEWMGEWINKGNQCMHCMNEWMIELMNELKKWMDRWMNDRLVISLYLFDCLMEWMTNRLNDCFILTDWQWLADCFFKWY